MQSSAMQTRALSAVVSLMLLLHLPASYAKVLTNADPVTGGIELPLYTKNFVLACNNTPTGSMVDHWELNGIELRDKDLNELGISKDPDNHSLVIANARKHHEGNYTCVFPDNEKALIVVKAKPEAMLESELFVPGTTSLNLVEGASLHLLCKSKSNDSANVRWQMQPEDMSDDPEEVTSDPSYNVFQNSSTSDSGTSAALLNIRSVVFSDRAYYICRVDNGIAASDLRVLVRVKDKLAALWPFLIIVAEVLVLCTVIFIYEKRRSKSDDLDDDAAITSKPSSPAKSAQEVRQRK